MIKSSSLSFLFHSKKALLFYQIIRFGLVGILAALLHFSVVVLLVQIFSLKPLIANIMGFLAGFQLSYVGHRYFTFRGTKALSHIAYMRLMICQINNFILNETLFYFLLSLHFSYQVALIIVLASMPIFTFMISKFWVFR